ncbi:Uma2 family endonuclease [Streptomyces sp. NPDC021622]|uniref:Uma2 family endonuclease n=1 Tax=Streptomyces sp. NPDC021622 TaxID=3155013 RepID=UPI0033D8856F
MIRTQREIYIQLCEQVGDAALGAIEFAHPEWDQKRSPDLIVWHGDEEDPAPYDADAIELAMEIVSPSSVENDYVIKPDAYAVARIPACLVLDPYTRSWTLFTDPSPRGYRERASGPYGKTVTIEAGERTLAVATAALPPAKEWQLRDAWPAHRTSAGAY